MEKLKDLADRAMAQTYYGVGYSTKDGFSVGAQSTNVGDNYGIDADRSRGSNAVDKALGKVRSSPAPSKKSK